MRALGELGDAQGAERAPASTSRRDLDARVRRRIREVVRDLAEPRRASEHLRDDLEKLQTEHHELKARLAKLEARVGEPAGGRRDTAPAPKAKKGKKRP